MDPLSLGLTIGKTALPVIGGVVSSIFGSNSQKSTNEANMELAKYQYEKNLEMWNRNNEYNTPEQQRKRMEAAGFNPNLVYGHGSVVNTSSSVPQYSAPTMQAYTNYPNLGDAALQGLLQTEQVMANVRKTNAEAEKAEVDAKNALEFGFDNARIENEHKATLLALDNFKRSYEELKSAKYKDMAQWEIEILENNMEKSAQELLNLHAQFDVLTSDARLKESQIGVNDTIKGLNISNIDLNKSKKKLTDAQAVTEGHRPAYIDSLSNYNNANTRYITSRHIGQYLENKMLRMKVKLAPDVLAKEYHQLEANVRYVEQKIDLILRQQGLTDAQREKAMYDAVVSGVDADFANYLKSLGFIGSIVNLFK